MPFKRKSAGKADKADKADENSTDRSSTPLVRAGSDGVGPPAETFLGEASVLAGDLRFADDVRIEGRIEGQIRGSKSVVVAAPAEVDATIEAESVEIHGRVVGDLHVRRQTTLHKSASVEGEIRTAGIVVEEGARFRGVIVIGPEEGEALPRLEDAKGPAQMREPAPTRVDGDDGIGD